MGDGDEGEEPVFDEAEFVRRIPTNAELEADRLDAIFKRCYEIVEAERNRRLTDEWAMLRGWLPRNAASVRRAEIEFYRYFHARLAPADLVELFYDLCKRNHRRKAFYELCQHLRMIAKAARRQAPATTGVVERVDEDAVRSEDSP